MNNVSKQTVGAALLWMSVANIGMASAEGGKTPSEGQGFSIQKFVSDVTSQMIAGLVGAGCGETLAFRLEQKSKNKRQRERDLASANLMLFLLNRMWDYGVAKGGPLMAYRWVATDEVRKADWSGMTRQVE